MRPLHILAAAALVALAGCSALPASDAKHHHHHHGHAAHHPTGAPSNADTAKVDQHMKMMEDMHQKMQAAKTPAERSALMKDHMAAMQGGMAMMGQMRGGGMSMHEHGKPPIPGAGTMHRGKHMMERRMDMMEMMMQMMMDREAGRPPAAR